MTVENQKDFSDLEKKYKIILPNAQFFIAELERQIVFILQKENVTLGVPIERRIKEWVSITRNINENSPSDTALELPTDLVGIRIILLFQRDVDKVCEIIKKKFKVLKQVDKKADLQEKEFGYSSFHFIVKQPDEWQSVPTLETSSDLLAEIQVRTLSQHIWAAASHFLQYKKEDSVPPIARRSINRVAALLETVDLEFERALAQRESYINSIDKNINTITDQQLNVDSLEKILGYSLPAENKRGNEDYSNLLNELIDFQVNTPSKLTSLIDKHKNSILEKDKKEVETRKKSKSYVGTSEERINSGVFYTHAGLIRKALALEFGKKFEDYKKSKILGKQIK